MANRHLPFYHRSMECQLGCRSMCLDLICDHVPIHHHFGRCPDCRETQRCWSLLEPTPMKRLVVLVHLWMSAMKINWMHNRYTVTEMIWQNCRVNNVASLLVCYVEYYVLHGILLAGAMWHATNHHYLHQPLLPLGNWTPTLAQMQPLLDQDSRHANNNYPHSHPCNAIEIHEWIKMVQLLSI